MTKLVTFIYHRMIEIKNLSVRVGDKKILEGINMQFEKGKTYFLLGKNGSGKSSLALTLMGHPRYNLETGSLIVDGVDISLSSPNDRSKTGLFLSLQNVPEIKGIKLIEYLRTIYNERLKEKSPETKALSPFVFKRFIATFLKELSIPETFLERDLNVGFSGGEKRKIEILQMKLLEPKYILLDEIDSGLDIDAFKSIASLLQSLKWSDNTLVIITHNFKMLEYLHPDEVIILKNGVVAEQGGKELVDRIEKEGFEKVEAA